MGGAAPLRCVLVVHIIVAALSPSAIAVRGVMAGGGEMLGRGTGWGGREDGGEPVNHPGGGNGHRHHHHHHQRHRRFLRQVNPNMNALDGDNPFTVDAPPPQQQQQRRREDEEGVEQRTFSVTDEAPKVVRGVGGAGPGDLGYDPMNIRSRVNEASEALSAEEGAAEALNSIREQAVAGEFGDGSALQKAASSRVLSPEEEERMKMIDTGKDIADIISASNAVKDTEEEEVEETAASLAHNSVAAEELVSATEVDMRDITSQDHHAIAAANNARAAAAKEENVQQELKMLENLMLQELEVKRKLDASFQSKVVEEMTKSKAAIEEAKARERQLKVRELELEVRLEKQMREQNAQLTSASAQLTRQMGEAARQQQYMGKDVTSLSPFIVGVSFS